MHDYSARDSGHQEEEEEEEKAVRGGVAEGGRVVEEEAVVLCFSGERGRGGEGFLEGVKEVVMDWRVEVEEEEVLVEKEEE